MKIERSVARKIGWLIVGSLILYLAWCSSGASIPSQPQSPAQGLNLHGPDGLNFFDLDDLRGLAPGIDGLGDISAPLPADIE